MGKQSIFYTGGALPLHYCCYVSRKADQDALSLTLNKMEMKSIYLKGAKQTGKTSFFKKIADYLRSEGWICCIIDLSTIKNLKRSKWFRNLGKMIAEECKIHPIQSSLKNQRDFRSFLLDEVGIQGSPIKIILFFDEIEALLDLKFSDEFLMTLREMYQQRYSYQGQFQVALAGSIEPSAFGRCMVMPEKTPEIKILDEVRRGGYTVSLITTYNAYLPFYEQVVLRRLISTGVRQNILLMDAGQCHQSIISHPPRFAGRSYSLLPMQSSEVFHPKVILLVGKHKGLLLVGSHNMTLSGFGYNREISNAIRLQNKDDTQAIGLFMSAWQQIEGWLQAQQHYLPEELLHTVLALPKSIPWMKPKHAEPSPDVTILSTQPGAASLWEQLLPHISAPVRRILFLGAFFDRQLAFIKRLQQDLQPEECFVGIDPATVRVPPDVLKQQQGINIVNVQRLGTLDDRKHGYLHAKCLVIQTTDNMTYLISGSTNPTASAWLKPGLSGNTEMVVLRRGVKAEAKWTGN